MKADVVNQGVSDLQAALTQAESDFLGAFYEKVVADQPAPSGDGGFSQADVDAKVAQALADAKVASDQALADEAASDAQALSDAVSAVQAQLDAANQALADAIAKDKKDSAAAQALKASVVSIQAALDALSALVADDSSEAPAPSA